jgi:hypothetical protein
LNAPIERFFESLCIGKFESYLEYITNAVKRQALNKTRQEMGCFEALRGRKRSISKGAEINYGLRDSDEECIHLQSNA